MDFALVYLAHRFIYRVFDFFHHWYVDGSRAFLARFLTVFGGLERSLALGTTFAHFFEPLYKDYSAMGRILGIPFRVGRIVLGGTFYVLFITVFASQNVPPVELMHVVFGIGKAVVAWLITSFAPPALPGEISLP